MTHCTSIWCRPDTNEARVPSEPTYACLPEMEEFNRGLTHSDLACEKAVKVLMGAAYVEAVRRGDSKIALSLLVEAVDVVWDLRVWLESFYAKSISCETRGSRCSASTRIKSSDFKDHPEAAYL